MSQARRNLPLSIPSRSLLLFVLLASIGLQPVAAQVPETFSNLKVLPQDIARGQLIEVMKGFCRALAVRCQHCHVGEEGKSLSTFDFASDDKPPKVTARIMMKMVQEINATYLAQLGHQPAARTEVGCMTCHHGQQRPQTLDQALAAVLAEKDLEAALAHYQVLRQQHYGRGRFDFGERSLRRLAVQRLAAGKPAEAIAFLELNLEHHPESAVSFFLLGDAYDQVGERDKAIASLIRGLALQPENPLAKEQLKALRGSD